MALDVYSLVEQLRDEDAFYRVSNSTSLQLGTRDRPFMMSLFLPEETVTDNIIRDERVEMKSVIARDAARAQPVVYRKAGRVGRQLVELGDSNTGAQFTGDMYEQLMHTLSGGTEQSQEEAATTLLNYEQMQIALPLAILREKQRCDAVVYARVIREGDGNFYEVVDYPNPAGHRFSVPSGTLGSPAGWYNLTGYDPFSDIVGIRDSLITNEGISISRIITTQKMYSLLNRNQIVQQYGGVITRHTNDAPFVGGVNMQGMMQNNAILGALAHHGLPSTPGEDFFLYDGRYDVESQDKSKSTERFIPDNVLIMLGTTARSAEIELGDDIEPLPLYNTLGYTALGRPLGTSRSGVKTGVFTNDRHPPSIDFEGNQTSLPVIQDADRIVVITIPDPTA